MFDFFKKKQMGTGAVPRPFDIRDRIYDEVAMGFASLDIDWINGFNIEDKLKVKLPIKNQDGSSSCVGQGWSYYIAILDLLETKEYSEVSAKAIYSQIYLPSGNGAYIMDGGKLAVNWGAVNENLVSSYNNGKPPSETFMRDLSWKDEYADKMAKILQAKEYRRIEARDNMDLFAMAIRDNWGVVGGIYIGNNGSWSTENPIPSTREGGHCVYFSAYGTDEKGKYIATLNSWGERNGFRLQKLRQDYFNRLYQFDPWVLVDLPNVSQVSPEAQNVLNNNEKKIVVEGEGVGRKGIVINGKLVNITKDRAAEACLYTLANNGYGITINTKLFDEIYDIDDNF